MSIEEHIIQFLKRPDIEGCKLKAYLDSAGVHVKPNWELGAMTPMLDYKRPTFDVGYRLFSDFYVHAQVDVFNRNGSVGFLILL